MNRLYLDVKTGMFIYTYGIASFCFGAPDALAPTSGVWSYQRYVEDICLVVRFVPPQILNPNTMYLLILLCCSKYLQLNRLIILYDTSAIEPYNSKGL